MTKKEIKKLSDGPLTLQGLILYNEKVFSQMLEKRFISKKELGDGLDTLERKLEKKFVTKTEFNKFKKEIRDFKKDMLKFKGDTLEFKARMESFAIEMIKFKVKTEDTQTMLVTNMDKILKKLDILLGEKKVQDYQDEKRKKMCGLMVGAAAKHKMITPRQVDKIERWEVL